MPAPFYKPDTFIGLDMSLAATGVCALKHWTSPGKHWLTNFSVARIGTLTPPDKLTGPARLEWIFNQLAPILETDRPKLVAIEGYAHGASFQAHALGEVGGMARLLLWKLGIPFVEVQPTTLKKYLTGDGQATKAKIKKSVKARWGRDIKDNNQADAFGLALLATLSTAPYTPNIHTISAAELDTVSGLRLCIKGEKSPFPLISRQF